MAADAFYHPIGGGRYAPTEATTSPWDSDAQHGGPPTALLATAMERVVAEATPGLRLARITVELLGPVPRREVTVTAAIARPGRRVVMSEATLAVDGRTAVVARAWHVSPAATPPAPTTAPEPAAVPAPADLPDVPAALFRGLPPDWGYGRAIDWRFTEGGYDRLGPAAVWTRLRVPFVAGEPVTGAQRALVVADSANGISGELPFGEWLFVPTSVTVHLQRHPDGEWVHLAARTFVGADGVGLTTGSLADAGGVLGTVDQPLLIVPAP